MSDGDAAAGVPDRDHDDVSAALVSFGHWKKKSSGEIAVAAAVAAAAAAAAAAAVCERMSEEEDADYSLKVQYPFYSPTIRL